jgi:iron-sulfur cluster repair protein YtfE (RIC family)
MPATSRKRSTSSRSKSNGRATKSRSAADAISLLKQDHQKVRQLLKRLESNGTEELLSEIENELKVHTQIEEEIFYPAFKEAVQSEKEEHLYYEALEEHHVVDMVLPEIKHSSEGSDEFSAKSKVLKDLVEHHAEEEETQMFPKARKAMGAARLRELGEVLKERKQELMRGLAGRTTTAFERMLRPVTGEARGARKSTTSNGRNRRRAA